MIRRLYDWTLSLAARKTAQVWLAVIAFVESSIFLIPADVLFLPMALSRPERAYRYALIATLASTLGGIAGYLLGSLAYETAAKPSSNSTENSANSNGSRPVRGVRPRCCCS